MLKLIRIYKIVLGLLLVQERKSWRNQLKRTDIYTCGFASHKRFQNAVSVYHVLKEKKCYPEGCIYFLWTCRRLSKGKNCPKKFRHVGRKCFSCPDFEDIKRCYTPKIIIDPKKFESFQNDLREFENWFQELKGKEIDFSGTIHSVKPHLTRRINEWTNRLRFHGFLVVFNQGYFHYDHYDDFCYLRITRRQQQNWQFRKDDNVEMNAVVDMDKGRIILKRPRQVEIFDRKENNPLQLDRIMMDVKTGVAFSFQHEKCLVCEQGCLIDVLDESGGKIKKYRQIFCLEGLSDPAQCPYQAFKKIEADRCIQEMEIEGQAEKQREINSPA